MSNTTPVKNPHLLRPDQAQVCEIHCTREQATLKLWPTPAGVRAAIAEQEGMANERYVWRHYNCGALLFCGVGVSVDGGSPLYRDAAPPKYYKDGADGSFLAAAAMYDFGRGLMESHAFRVPGDRVRIDPEPAPDGKSIRGYKLGEKLHVGELAYAEDGSLQRATICNAAGEEVAVWQQR